jgi:competence protein ComEC
MIAKPLPGAGEENPSCAGMEPMTNNGGEENARSTASVISYGKARIAAFGDLTWDREKDLFCPTDKVGKVDVYLATHHSTALSGSPAAVNALAPIVAIVGNSARKGDDPERIKTIEDSPRIQDIWRLHASTVNPGIDGDPNLIANLDADQSKDHFYSLRLRIMKDGEVTVINERSGFNKTYQAK